MTNASLRQGRWEQDDENPRRLHISEDESDSSETTNSLNHELKQQRFSQSESNERRFELEHTRSDENKISERNRSSSWSFSGTGAMLLGTTLLAASAYLGMSGDHGTTPDDMSSMDAAEGHYVTGLQADYIGMKKGFVGEAERINFESRLEQQWERKRSLADDKAAIDDIVTNKVGAYDNKTATKTSLDTYLDRTHATFDGARKHTDWEGVQLKYGLDDAEVSTVRSVLDQVDEDMLGAYMMTELFPAMNGDSDARRRNALTNRAVFEEMLEHGGTEYVALLPAVGDDEVSFGPFQHTLYIVNDEPLGAATRNNDVIRSSYDTPANMTDMAEEDHAEAAYSLLLTHVARLADNPGISEALSDVSDDELSMIIAGLHHHPRSARNTVETWGRTGKLQASSFKTSEDYVAQTQTNHKVLEGGMRPTKRLPSSYFEEERVTGDAVVYDVRSPLDRAHPDTIASQFNNSSYVRQGAQRIGSLNVVEEDGTIFDGSGEVFVKAYHDDL